MLGPSSSTSTQKKGSQHSSSIQRQGSKPTSSTHKLGSQKPGPSSFAKKKECQPISSTQRAGSWKPEPSSLSNIPKVVSAAAPQITKNVPFTKAEDTHTSTEGASVSPGPSSSTQTQNPFETGSLTPTSTSRSFRYLKVSELTHEQQEALRTRLCVESEDIVDKFWCLHSRVYKSLCERHVPVDKLVTHLLTLPAFDPVYKDLQKPALQTFFQELRSAGSVEDVLYIISDYISFFNYHVIEHTIDGLGTDQDKAELQNYKKEFDEYSKRRIFECPPVYGSKSSADHDDLVVKVDSVYDEYTVKELNKFQYRLGRTLYISPQSVLRLCQVEEGCLQLIFQVPSFVQQEIFPLSSEQERILAAEGVIRLTCGDYQFAAKVCIIMCSGLYSYCAVTYHCMRLCIASGNMNSGWCSFAFTGK